MRIAELSFSRRTQGIIVGWTWVYSWNHNQVKLSYRNFVSVDEFELRQYLMVPSQLSHCIPLLLSLQIFMISIWFSYLHFKFIRVLYLMRCKCALPTECWESETMILLGLLESWLLYVYMYNRQWFNCSPMALANSQSCEIEVRHH